MFKVNDKNYNYVTWRITIRKVGKIPNISYCLISTMLITLALLLK